MPKRSQLSDSHSCLYIMRKIVCCKCIVTNAALNCVAKKVQAAACHCRHLPRFFAPTPSDNNFFSSTDSASAQDNLVRLPLRFTNNYMNIKDSLLQSFRCCCFCLFQKFFTMFDCNKFHFFNISQRFITRGRAELCSSFSQC